MQTIPANKMKTTNHLNRLHEDLSYSLNWISSDPEKSTRLETLLFESFNAAGDNGVEIIDKILRRCVYLSTQDYEESIEEIAKHLVGSFNHETTLVCATTADTDADSAQKVLYDLKSVLAAMGLVTIKSCNRHDRAYSYKGQYSDLLLVDEFVGTGQSLRGRTERIRRQFRENSKPAPRIHAAVIAAMEDGISECERSLDSIWAAHKLKKGIYGHAKEDERAREYLAMNHLEDALEQTYNGIPLPRLGYGSSEAIYGRSKGNCPNNVFPVLWWPTTATASKRKPFFPRSF
jgi:hypothetical protein